MTKAMLLAAGRGVRLRPLTDTLPKPLVSVGGETLLEHNLRALRRAGIEEVVINVCYRAKQIIDQVGDGSRYDLSITFSYEPEKPLGTGGGIKQALPFLGNDPFLLISSDIWTDYSFSNIQLPTGKLAHLVLVENPAFHPNGDFGLNEKGFVLASAPQQYTYGNVAMIDPSLFHDTPDGEFSIAPLLVEQMNQQNVTGEIYRGRWFNVGTVEELDKLGDVLKLLAS